MDRFERIADGKALDEIRTSMGFMALERLLDRMREDALMAMALDGEGRVSRKETKGKLAVLAEIISSVDAEIEYVRSMVNEEEETLRISRGVALEGGGTGDLT